MIIRKTRLAALVMILLACASRAGAQQPPQPPADEPGWLGDSLPPLWDRIFLNVNAAGQLELMSFGRSGTFDSFNEVGGLATNQNVGRGMLLDVTGGYRLNRHLGVGVGVWTAVAKSAVSGSAAMPDPLVYGQYVTSNLGADDLRQTIIGVNLQAVVSQSFGEHLAVSGFIGPTFAQVRQDIGSMSVAADSRNPTLVIDRQSARTTRAASVGLDITWMLSEQYGIGVIGRYVAGEVDLPAVAGVKVGGAQLGAGVRYRF
jgi:hypothetical protein